MAKAKIILLKIKTQKDGTHPVVVRITQGTKRNYFFLGYSCTPEQWVEDPPRFNSKYKYFRDHNKVLDEKEELVEKIMAGFNRDNVEFSLNRFKREFEAIKQEDLTVLKYLDLHIKELENTGKLGSAAVYRDARNRLKKFKGGSTLKLQDVDKRFLTKYKEWLLKSTNKQGQPLSDRTVSIYLRAIRSIYYKALKNELLDPALNPFGKGKFSVNEGLKMKTRKRAIKKAEVDKIRDYQGEYKDARNFFMFSYYAGGMNFIDMALLKWSNIINGRIIYERRKTKSEYNIKVNAGMQEILDKYHGGDYVFPILFRHHKTPKQVHEAIKTANKKFNKELRAIAEDVGIKDYLTSYVARHSMASVLYWEKGHSIGEVASLMGHTDLSTTQIYLDELDIEKKDEIQDDLL